METIGKPSTLQAYSPESVPKANSHSFRGSWWILLDEGSVPETFFLFAECRLLFLLTGLRML